jgi:hypothetical protein
MWMTVDSIDLKLDTEVEYTKHAEPLKGFEQKTDYAKRTDTHKNHLRMSFQYKICTAVFEL